MTERTDEQVLAEAMGWEWFDEPGYFNPAFDNEHELWSLLQCMMGREDWKEFHFHAWDQYTLNVRDWRTHGFFPWLLHTDSTGCRLVRLAAGWVREHGGGA